MKPRLVLTGKVWPNTDNGYVKVAMQLDWSRRDEIRYVFIEDKIYEYEVQYQTPKNSLVNCADLG
jgi:hypothetical protein